MPATIIKALSAGVHGNCKPYLVIQKWNNFLNVIGKAKKACENAGGALSDHFADVGKMVTVGSGVQREVEDIALTRYACYLIAQNGDPSKPPIAFAQTLLCSSNPQARNYRTTLIGC